MSWTWWQTFLQELSPTVASSIPLSNDNQDAIHIASNPVFLGRTRNILTGTIATLFVKSKGQHADIFIKALCRNYLESICSKLGLYDIYVPAWGRVLEVREIILYCVVWAVLEESRIFWRWGVLGKVSLPAVNIRLFYINCNQIFIYK